MVTPTSPLLLMEEILHQWIASFYPINLQGFMHLNWCRISSINSIIPWPLICLEHFSRGILLLIDEVVF